jgi:nitrite reductase (NO-forming)
VREGQKVVVTLTNRGTMAHSVDFHAAQVAPNVDFSDIGPGASKTFGFVAKVPGVFIPLRNRADVRPHRERDV